MEFTIRNMTDAFAIEILSWKYEAPYDLYNNVLSGDAILELTSNSYKVILSEEKVIGFYCTGKDAQVPAGQMNGAYDEDYLDLGLGMRPELTGKGLGTEFFQYILQEIKNRTNQFLRLTVAEFNERAIRLYEKFNFIQKYEFVRGDRKFIVMVKED